MDSVLASCLHYLTNYQSTGLVITRARVLVMKHKYATECANSEFAFNS